MKHTKIFEHDGETYEAVSGIGCEGCVFNGYTCNAPEQAICSAFEDSDEVIFKKISNNDEITITRLYTTRDGNQFDTLEDAQRHVKAMKREDEFNQAIARADFPICKLELQRWLKENRAMILAFLQNSK